ncbi:hypothetical protein PHYBOEH_003531 [Phytophthora boehmeriae]|uniref:Uncharacterized protein n=1 Tax=Phytophthora boehmeriae TaxID=109152 RepID=A0A8T1X7W3_9STRA|nr:hypothetical protein PHYBOEH_003531 [Phytophthora boehmeriae]
MAFWADRERGGAGTSWEVDRWDSASEDEQDALFGSLGGDIEDEDEQDRVNDLFCMTSMDSSPELELVERLSWDATSQGSNEEEEVVQLPEVLSIQVGACQEDGDSPWNLVSPCSETASPCGYLSPLTRVSISSPKRKQFFEPENEPEQVAGEAEKEVEQEQEDSDDSEEEVKTFDPETGWSPERSSILFTSVVGNPFAPAEEEPKDRANDSSDDEDETHERNSDGSPLRPSLLPRVPSVARWRRQKARTCSGAGSAGMPSALALAKFKTRTRSFSRSRNQSFDEDDDGDFSSDDEGYTPELHHRRGSETESIVASRWRNARNSSMSFTSHRLSVNVSMNQAMMTKRLQDAKTKLSCGLHYMRSGSTSTVTSEESFLGSPYCESNKSAPPGLQLEGSSYPDDTAPTSLSSVSACDIGNKDQHHRSRQQQLRAGVFKAAGLLNAASAEAARKLKSRAGGFRAPHLPRHKPPASETEEEELEASTSLPPASPIPVKVTSTAS